MTFENLGLDRKETAAGRGASVRKDRQHSESLCAEPNFAQQLGWGTDFSGFLAEKEREEGGRDARPTFSKVVALAPLRHKAITS
jgi:hypothetical protein